MSSQRRAFFSLIFAMLIFFTATTLAFAEEIVADENGITGFERYDNGLIWWSSGGECGGEFPHDSAVRLRAILAGQTTKLALDCTLLPHFANNAVADDAYVYFFDENSQLLRKALNAAEGDPAQPLAMAAPLQNQIHDGPLALAEGNLYWPMYNAGVNVSSIRRMPADGSQTATTLTSVNGHVVKLQWYRYPGSNGNVDVLLWITGDGKLSRYVIGQGSPVQLATSITDFNVHTRYGLGTSSTVIYAAQGTVTPSPGVQAGKLLQIDIETGVTTTVYDPTIDSPNNKNQVIGVTSDNNSSIFNADRNVYIAVASVSCGELLCALGNVSIHRRKIPAETSGWELVVATDARSHLRSDDQWLYYVSGDGRAIERVKTDAPALELDIKADDVEIVQTIQSLAQDVMLVANKPTFVRGYAHLAKNTTGKGTWMPEAVLQGFVGNQELPGSPLHPLNNVGLDSTSDVNAIRNSTTRSYLFQLPDSWVKNAGSLRVDLVVDPQQVLPETGSRADNTASKTANVVKKADTCLDFVRMHTATTIDANPTGLTEIVARARSLLPVQQFQVRTSSTIISKPVLYVEIECWAIFCVPVPYIRDEPFVMKEDKDWALTLLTLWDTFTSDFGACDDSHLVGMVHPSEPSFNGQGLTSFSNDLMVRMEPTNWGATDFNSPYGGRTLAHELGHNYGRQHIDQTTSPLMCGGSQPAGPYDSYPYDACTLGSGYNGFDGITRSLIPSNMSGDLMSYNGTRWTSKYTWDAILDKVSAAGQSVQSAAISAPNADMLLVSGLVTPTQNTARFETFYLFPEGAAPQSEVVKSLAGAAQAAAISADPYQIRQLDANGAVLTEDTALILTGADDVGESMPFAQYVPFNPATRRIQLVQGSTVLAEKVMSANAPSLTLASPVVDEAKQTLALKWMAADADNTLAGGFTEVLYFTVQYSPDNGATWHSLLVQYPWLAATVDTQMLPGSTQARVRVLATDGFNTAIATSEPFVLAKHAPVPLIGNLVDGQRVPYTGTIQLLGMALDAEDGSLADERLNWSIDGSTLLTGTGSQLGLPNLVPGSYTATLSAADSDGQTGSTTIDFEVLPVIVPDTNVPVLDGFCSDAGYVGAPLVRIPLANGATARAWLLHAEEKLYVCFADLQLAPAAAPAMVAGLRIDADNSGGDQVQDGDLGFLVDENGVPYQLVANGGVLQVTLSPQPGYAVVVERTANGWSAELAIAHDRIGGWNHAARLMLHHTAVDAVVAAGSAAQSDVWPSLANGAQPSTWGSIYLGALPQPGNLAPVAVAGTDLYANVAVTKTIGLDGSGSFDPDGDTLTYAWSQSEGPAVTIDSVNTAHPTFQVAPVATPATLRFQLVVNDGTANSAADEVVVTLVPAPQPHTAQTFTPADLVQLFLPAVTR